MLLSLFKKIVYANELSELEEFYCDLQSADIVQKYPSFLTYVNTVYEDKDGWALPYRKTSLTRGNHTNNTVESQFLVFKDTLLQLNTIQILYLINLLMSYELMEHYQNKLLSVASGSFDGHYSRRFKGKSKNKDEHIGFKLPGDESLKRYETQIRVTAITFSQYRASRLIKLTLLI